MRQYGLKGALVSVALAAVVFGVVYGIDSFSGAEPDPMSRDFEERTDVFLLSVMAGGALAVGAAAFVMRFLTGSDDEPLDYDRL
jgi:hypothetical protein